MNKVKFFGSFAEVPNIKRWLNLAFPENEYVIIYNFDLRLDKIWLEINLNEVMVMLNENNYLVKLPNNTLSTSKE
jgi:hypothetical protein